MTENSEKNDETEKQADQNPSPYHLEPLGTVEARLDAVTLETQVERLAQQVQALTTDVTAQKHARVADMLDELFPKATNSALRKTVETAVHGMDPTIAVRVIETVAAAVTKTPPPSAQIPTGAPGTAPKPPGRYDESYDHAAFLKKVNFLG
ncbi:MAG: hypothetical protein SXV54_24295 [Chloroflexota bacterium]|nr:hypothetical protein [Chloroflexota bacterium]